MAGAVPPLVVMEDVGFMRTAVGTRNLPMSWNSPASLSASRRAPREAERAADFDRDLRTRWEWQAVCGSFASAVAFRLFASCALDEPVRLAQPGRVLSARQTLTLMTSRLPHHRLREPARRDNAVAADDDGAEDAVDLLRATT
jgi:hypothetical protein